MTDQSGKSERVVLQICASNLYCKFICEANLREFCFVLLNVICQWPPIYFVYEPDYNGGENYVIQTGLKNQCIFKKERVKLAQSR